METQESTIAKTLLKKKKIRELTLFNFNTYYRDIKVMWHQDRHVDQ